MKKLIIGINIAMILVVAVFMIYDNHKMHEKIGDVHNEFDSIPEINFNQVRSIITNISEGGPKGQALRDSIDELMNTLAADSANLRMMRRELSRVNSQINDDPETISVTLIDTTYALIKLEDTVKKTIVVVDTVKESVIVTVYDTINETVKQEGSFKKRLKPKPKKNK